MHRVFVATLTALVIVDAAPVIARGCGSNKVALQVLGSGGPFPSASASTSSLVRIVRANSYFASPAKPGAFVPHAMPKEPRPSELFFKRGFWKNVGHAVWTFSIPTMLRPYFLFRRELLTELARAGYETVQELMAAAVDDKNLRVGMVASIQTFSDNLDWNPHLHCLVSRGVWLAGGQWIPVPYIDAHAAEVLFREKVFRLLQEHDLLSDERIKVLRSWRRSGFNIDNDLYLYPADTQALERLVVFNTPR